MYGTAAWLLWVFTLQAGDNALALILAAAVLVGLFAWLIGTTQAAGKPLVPGVAAVLALVLAVACLAAGARQTAPATAQTADAAPAGRSEAPSQPFSPAKLADLRAQGKPVFVNFTAAWCVTCQVNDKLALSSPKVADAFRNAGMAYLKGDWTNRDAVIAKVLAEHGRAGVPLYLVYGSGGRDAVVLPQILTEGVVLNAVRAAQR
jgi:thiol:disulfide interchange protein DsbD